MWLVRSMGVWQNDRTLIYSDWIVNLGPTITSFTGPEGDKNVRGRYLYIENQPVPIVQGEQGPINLITDLS